MEKYLTYYLINENNNEFFNDIEYILLKLKEEFFKLDNNNNNENNLPLLVEKFQEYENNLLLQYVKIPNIPIKFFAFIKYITKTWLNNLTKLDKIYYNKCILYFACYDTLFISTNQNIINKIPFEDGNKSCDISMNLILVDTILSIIFEFIKNYIANDDIKSDINIIYNSFRIGIIKDNNNCIEDQLIIYKYDEQTKVYIFFINLSFYLFKEKQLTFLSYSLNIIQLYINLYLPWLTSIIINNILSTYIHLYPNLLQSTLNYFEYNNIKIKIINNFKILIQNIKDFKIMMYNIYNNNFLNLSKININLDISTRKKSKKRQRKCKNSDLECSFIF